MSALVAFGGLMSGKGQISGRFLVAHFADQDRLDWVRHCRGSAVTEVASMTDGSTASVSINQLYEIRLLYNFWSRKLPDNI